MEKGHEEHEEQHQKHRSALRALKNVLLLHSTQRPNNTSRSPFRTSRPKVEFNLTVYKIVSTIPVLPPIPSKNTLQLVEFLCQMSVVVALL